MVRFLYDEAHKQKIARRKANLFNKDEARCHHRCYLDASYDDRDDCNDVRLSRNACPFFHDPWVQLILAILASFILVGAFYEGAYHAIKANAPIWMC